MKVVHIVHCFLPEFRGGTETCLQNLAAAQTARGDEPVVIAGSTATSPDAVTRTERVEGLKVHRVLRRPAEQYTVDFRLPRMAAEVERLVALEQPDVVHLHHWLHLSGDLAARLAGAGCTMVATLHDFTLVCARFFLVRPDGASCANSFPLPSDRCHSCVLPDFGAGSDALQRELEAKRATARSEAAALSVAICPSAMVRERWLASGMFDADVLVELPHAVALADRRAAPPRDRSDGHLVLATWGNLAPAKGLLDLLGALRAAGDARLKLIILGRAVDTEHEAELHEAARGLAVEFRGAFKLADLAALRGEADLAVFPSRAEETFGLVAAEARVLGFPVVVSARGALPEVVGAGGTTAPAADPRAWAELLGNLLEDDERLAAWARAPAPDLPGPARHADRVADLYARALEAGA